MWNNFVIPFLPWMLYIILVKSFDLSPTITSLISLVLTLFFSWSSIKKMYILPITTLIFFSLSIILGVFDENLYFLKHPGLFIYLTLFGISLISIIIKQPFTIQYAKEQAPPEHWNSNLFLKINYHLTLFWGIIFLVCSGLSFLSIHLDNGKGFLLVFTLFIQVFGVFITMKYPTYLVNRSTSHTV